MDDSLDFKERTGGHKHQLVMGKSISFSKKSAGGWDSTDGQGNIHLQMGKYVPRPAE
jgi:hypothetical protein